MLFAWIPFCGIVISWPIALIGLVLGIIGWALAQSTRTTGLAVPITGTILCVVALVGSVAASSWFVRKTSQVQQARVAGTGGNTGSNTGVTVPAPTPVTPATPKLVAHPGTLTVGDFQVRLSSGELRADHVLIVLDVKNTAGTPLDFDLYAGKAMLKDDANTPYGMRVDVERAARAVTTVPPNQSMPYTFEFDAVQPGARQLILSIPANGQWHSLSIPRTALRKVD
jgi:hypothetical protein